MKKILLHLNTGSVAKVTGLVFFILGLIGVVLLVLVTLVAKPQTYYHLRFGAIAQGDIVFLLFMPINYGIAGFVFGYISAVAYNLVAKYVGGIKVELGPVSDEDQ